MNRTNSKKFKLLKRKRDTSNNDTRYKLKINSNSNINAHISDDALDGLKLKKNFICDIDFASKTLLIVTKKVFMRSDVNEFGMRTHKEMNSDESIYKGKIKSSVSTGMVLLERVLKNLANSSIDWMDYQVETILKSNKIMIRQYYRSIWKLKKKKILESYGICSLPYGLVVNIPRQMGKTLCVTRILAEWMRCIPGQDEKPFTIICPGILKGTYMDFVSKVKHHLNGFDLSDFRFVTNNKSEIELINKKNPRDIRKIIGLTVNSDVSNF